MDDIYYIIKYLREILRFDEVSKSKNSILIRYFSRHFCNAYYVQIAIRYVIIHVIFIDIINNLYHIIKPMPNKKMPHRMSYQKNRMCYKCTQYFSSYPYNSAY